MRNSNSGASAECRAVIDDLHGSGVGSSPSTNVADRDKDVRVRPNKQRALWPPYVCRRLQRRQTQYQKTRYLESRMKFDTTLRLPS